MLASLQGQLVLGLASVALQTQDNLLSSLGLYTHSTISNTNKVDSNLLVENRLGLTTISRLFAVVTTLTYPN